MNKFQLLGLILCVLVVSQSWIQAETNREDEDLKKQIKELQNQVENLEKRIKTLEKQLRSVELGSIAIPKTFPKLHKIPQDWKEYEFNGMKYYIIPIRTESKKTNLKNK